MDRGRMPARLECPKCYACRAWFERDGSDIVLRSICGVHIIVQSQGPAETIIEHSEARPKAIRLPKPGSALSACLGHLAIAEAANSAAITEALQGAGRVFTVSDVSSYLTMLRVKGLVRATDMRKGLVGGSTWVLTDTAKQLLGVN